MWSDFGSTGKNNWKYQTTEVEKNIKENSQIIIDELKAAIKLKQ